jgi:hypothetical protein
MMNQIYFASRIILGKRTFFFPLLLLTLIITLWFWRGAISGRGGIPILGRFEIPVEPFFQDDPRWNQEQLGTSNDTIGSAGCALSAVAMVLRFYGVDVDPKKLNDYLIEHNGYEREAWIKWEVAATFPPNKAIHRYEDYPSYGLIDWNLLWGNPVIIRIHRVTGKTHFLLLVGKQGFDYLTLDPAEKGRSGVYPFYELGTPIEALRFYQKK